MIDLLNHCGPIWLSYFGLAVVQNTLFLGLIFLLLHVLRDARAQTRYTIGLIGLAKLLVPPFLNLPAVRLPFEAAAGISLPGASGPISMLTLNPVPIGSASLVRSAVEPTLSGVIFIVWLGIAGGYLALSMISALRLKRMLRHATPVENVPWSGVRRSRAVDVFKSEGIKMPLTLGMSPGTIYVPADWDRWTRDCRRMVIAHETAHIERRDGLVQLLEVLGRAVYFFHPLVWLLTRELGVYREMACDDAAVSGGPESPAEYSGHLVEVAERILANPVGCHSASALLRQRHELLDRVKYQVKEGEMRLLSRSTKRIILVGLLVLSVPLSWYCGRAETESVESAQVPDGAPAAARKSASLAYVQVVVGAKGDIKVDGKTVVWENLERELKAKAGSDADRNVVVIRCAEGAKMGSLSDLQKILVKTGLTKVSYEDAEGNALALILPGEREKELLKQIDPDDVSTLVVGSDGGVGVDGRRVRIAEVKDIVRKLLVRNPYLVVSIRTGLDTEYSDFHAVLDQVKAAGAKRISVG